MIDTPPTERYGLEVPFVSAGMGFIALPPLAAAISNAGGFGQLACAVASPAVMHEMIAATRERTSRPFGVNLIIEATMFGPLTTAEHIEVRAEHVYPPWCSSGRRRLRNPLGTAQPIDVTILPNPDPNVNPYYSSYDYMGGGPVYKVPDGMPGSGNLLMVYHAEIPTVTTQSFYSVLALAKSTDDGKSWTDLGEIIRINQAYRKDLDSKNSPFCHLSNASSSGDGSCTTPFFPSTSTRLPPGRGMRPSIG